MISPNPLRFPGVCLTIASAWMMFSPIHRGLAQATPAPDPLLQVPKVIALADGTFKLGKVQFDKKLKTVRFAATVNMTDGLIEYLIVSSEGKTHESLLVTDVAPYDLHFVMLLLGAKAAPPQQEAPPENITREYLKRAPPLKGDPVEISISWKQNDKVYSAEAADFVFNGDQKTSMSRGPWTYNGSSISEGVFLAQEEKSIVAIITDPAALINNSRPGHDNDLIWSVTANKVPPLNTLVEVTVTLKAPTKDKP